jgi:hypothetical protein
VEEEAPTPTAKGGLKPIRIKPAGPGEAEGYIAELRHSKNLLFNEYRQEQPSTKARLDRVNGLRPNLELLSKVSAGLVELSFDDCNQLRPRDFGLLVNFKGLTRLEFKNCAFTDAALPLLAEIPKLTQLHIEKTQLTEKGLADLPPSVDHLFFFQTQLAPGGFKNLPVMPNLKAVIIHDTNIDDDGLAGLARQPKLATLQILNGKVTDAGLEQLKAAPNLDNLWLRNCDGITDAGLPHIQAIPKIRFFNLDGSKNVTLEGINGVLKARPDVGAPQKKYELK